MRLLAVGLTCHFTPRATGGVPVNGSGKTTLVWNPAYLGNVDV